MNVYVVCVRYIVMFTTDLPLDTTSNVRLVSWWPLVRAFEQEKKMGKNYWHWSSAWERWFQKRLTQIENGKAQPLAYQEWASCQELRGLGQIRKFNAKAETKAASLF